MAEKYEMYEESPNCRYYAQLLFRIIFIPRDTVGVTYYRSSREHLNEIIRATTPGLTAFQSLRKRLDDKSERGRRAKSTVSFTPVIARDAAGRPYGQIDENLLTKRYRKQPWPENQATPVARVRVLYYLRATKYTRVRVLSQRVFFFRYKGTKEIVAIKNNL